MSEIQTHKIKGTVFKYRCPSRLELESIMSRYSDNKLEYYENLILSCVVHPQVTFEEEEEGKVSLISKPFLMGDILDLGKTIVRDTGYFDPEAALIRIQNGDNYINTELGKYDCLALACIPGLSPTELWGMEPNHLFRLYMAAMVISQRIGINPRMFIEPEEYQKEMENAFRKQKIAATSQKAQQEAMSAFNFKHKSNVVVEDSKSFEM